MVPKNGGCACVPASERVYTCGTEREEERERSMFDVDFEVSRTSF